MSLGEVNFVNQRQKQGEKPAKILKKLRKDRLKAGSTGPSQSALYRVLKGLTYKPQTEETRGRPSTEPATMVTVASKERLKLIKASNNEFLVTWGDVHKATKKSLRSQGKLKKGVKMPSEDGMARAVRAETPVRARPGKHRISHSDKHKKMRYEKALGWAEYSESWWVDDIHAYIDSKNFVVAKGERDKLLMRASKIHHHLRTPSEGSKPGFVLPKKGRMLLGVPSVIITAAVAKDGIIFWHETEGRWNGESAALMYQDLGKALRRHYGNKRKFRVVEDGDPKGFQSKKGKDAKKEEKIESWLLSPHSPSMMPLDYSIWDEIERRTLAKRGRNNETAASYKKRLLITAKRLPKTYVKKTIRKMKGNIAAIVAAKGGNTEMD